MRGRRVAWMALCVGWGVVAALRVGAQNADAAPTEPAVGVEAGQPAGEALVQQEGESAAEVVAQAMGSVSFAKRLKAGGSTMIFLGLVSVAGLAFALERFFVLRRSAIAPDGAARKAKELWKNGKYEEIERLADTMPSTLTRIMAALIRHRHCPTLELSQLAGDIAGRELRNHLQRAYPIAVVATISPLLGLLGTVIGMIESFEIVAIAGSLGDASLLAGSISKALVTTAAGLIIALPALALYHFFKGRTNGFASLLEEQVNELIASWFMESQTAGPQA